MELTELLVVAMFLLTSRLTLTLTSPAPVCDPRLFNKLLRDSAALHGRLSQCSDLGPLPIPVLLPTVDFSLREWRAKTEQTKGQEVLGAVTLLLEGVIAARKQLSPSCLSSLLGQLTAQTHVLLGALQGLLGTPSLPKGQTAAHREPTAIFLSFQQLLRGKVRFLLHALRPILCARQDQTAPATPGSGSVPSIRTAPGLTDRTLAALERGPGSSATEAPDPTRIPGLLNRTASAPDGAPTHPNVTVGPSNGTQAPCPAPAGNAPADSHPPSSQEGTFRPPIPLAELLSPPSIPPPAHPVPPSPSPRDRLGPTARAPIPSAPSSATSSGNPAPAPCCLPSRDETRDLSPHLRPPGSGPEHS
ncbi:thrombopoietin [Antechinus flavipes]|uniref:thrombopoietin n=1 Tax=Antechinus flavipes TaxID=38775 RepID=UPI0022367B4B|nr:thrombopoietin [Antechinus flavipes]XP_051855921.1 thrombopoietin [Antechinus flavipes]